MIKKLFFGFLVLFLVAFFAILFISLNDSSSINQDELVNNETIGSNETSIGVDQSIEAQEDSQEVIIVSDGSSDPACPTDNAFRYSNSFRNCDCPNGYVKKEWPYGGYDPKGDSIYDYCEIDKDWEEFDSCSSQSDCSGSYICASRFEDGKDFRCTPRLYTGITGSGHCTPEDGCINS